MSTKSHHGTHMNRPTVNIALNKAYLQELPEDEKQVLENLRANYFESAKVEIDLHRSIFIVEHTSDANYLNVYKKRKEILDKFREPNGCTDAAGLPSMLSAFWLKVLIGAGIEFQHSEDEKILLHLVDIRSRMFTQPNCRMVIEFEFEKNKYFSNKILTKTYHIKCRAEPTDAVFYDGIEITNMEGCQIDWLSSKRKPISNSENGSGRSFFEYFSERPDSAYVNRGILDEEIAFGFYLREKIIPKAVFFFTGELCADNDTSEDEHCGDEELSEVVRSSEAEEENLAYKNYSQSDGDGDDERERTSDELCEFRAPKTEDADDEKEKTSSEGEKKCETPR